MNSQLPREFLAFMLVLMSKSNYGNVGHAKAFGLVKRKVRNENKIIEGGFGLPLFFWLFEFW